MQRKKILEEKPEPRQNRKKHAVAAVRTIKGEQTLIVWVYGEGKELKWIIGTTKKDYGVYKVSEKSGINLRSVCPEKVLLMLKWQKKTLKQSKHFGVRMGAKGV